MTRRAVFLVVAALGCRTPAADVDLAAAPLVPLQDVHPGIRVDLRYAGADNFTGQALYPPGTTCLLRAPVAARLARVQDRLAAQGLGLLVWDGYRPLAVQERMWALVPDTRYVADPRRGSRHNRGAAVDVTLVDAAGRPLEMPTAYDDFSAAAHRDAPCRSPAAAAHRALLEQAMEEAGFIGLATEWWHFDDPDWERYPIVGGAPAAAAPR